jgi:hypothetical protein
MMKKHYFRHRYCDCDECIMIDVKFIYKYLHVYFIKVKSSLFFILKQKQQFLNISDREYEKSKDASILHQFRLSLTLALGNSRKCFSISSHLKQQCNSRRQWKTTGEKNVKAIA